MGHEVTAQQRKYWVASCILGTGSKSKKHASFRGHSSCAASIPLSLWGRRLPWGAPGTHLPWGPPALEQLQVTAGIFTSAVCYTAPAIAWNAV